MPEQTMPTLTAPPKASLWRHRAFLLLWSGGAVSDLGSAISTLVIPLAAVQVLKASSFEVAMLGVLRRLPFLFLTLPAGVLVDRVNRRRLMIASDLARMAALAAIPIASFTTTVPLWLLYVATLVVASFTVLFDIADQSYLPNVLAADQLVDGNGKLRSTETAADAIGPTVGAALVTVMAATRAVVADSVSYALSALSLLLIRVPDRPGAAKTKRVGFREAIREGLSFVLREPVLRRVAVCSATANAAVSLITAIEVLFLLRSLDASTLEVGLMLAVGPLGGFAGSLVARRLAERLGTARVMWVALATAAPFAFLMPLASPGWGLLLYAVGWAAFNAAGAVYNTTQISYRQTVCPPELMGRMNASLRWVMWSTMPLGALLGGAAATWLGLRGAVWIGAGLMASTALWLLFSPLRRMRDFPVQSA